MQRIRLCRAGSTAPFIASILRNQSNPNQSHRLHSQRPAHRAATDPQNSPPRRFPMNRCTLVRGELGQTLSCPSESPNVIATATLSGAGRTHSGPLTHGLKTAGSSRPSSPARHKARSRQAIGCSPGIYIAPGLTAAPGREIGLNRVSRVAKPYEKGFQV